MIRTSVTISNKFGLHACVGPSLTKLAGTFASDISSAERGEGERQEHHGGVMMLAAGLGSEIEFEATVWTSRLPSTRWLHWFTTSSARASR